jgi:Asp-tRNA(Asn)/Glu-tRNA(Gln) amidotransferase A subunit family amidase
MPSADDLLALSATELSRRIASRDVSCRELMQASLARIEALNPRFNAIVSLRDPAQCWPKPASATPNWRAASDAAGCTAFRWP